MKLKLNYLSVYFFIIDAIITKDSSLPTVKYINKVFVLFKTIEKIGCNFICKYWRAISFLHNFKMDPEQKEMINAVASRNEYNDKTWPTINLYGSVWRQCFV